MGLEITMIVRPRRQHARMAALERVVADLRQAGHRVSSRLTSEAGDAARFASSAARARADLILAAGGDGTVNEVVNGIAGCSWWPRLGVLPIGTANDFAVGLGIPTPLDEAVAVALGGRALPVDVPRVNGRRFINVSTGGFGADAADEVAEEMKRLLGRWAYLITGLREFVELRPARASFHADGAELYTGDILLFAVGNGRQTGGGTLITPRAELDDGKLDVLIVPALPRIEFLALLPDIRAGTHVDSPAVMYLQAQTLMVEAGHGLSVNADGEALHGGRFDYTLESRRLSVMRPAAGTGERARTGEGRGS